MSRLAFVRATSLFLSAFALSCAAAPEERIGAAEEAALIPNALIPNALDPSALYPNGLDPSALASHALSPGALSPGALSALTDPGDAGALSREFLRYAVSCAFTPDQSLSLSWVDSTNVVHMESYPGLAGLAPSWSTQALDLAGQQWVSACLGARVNAKGVSVMLSSRGTHPALTTTDAERAAYTTREAVFFGNVFSASPGIYACYDPLTILPSQMANRVCAQPQLLTLDLNNLSLGYNCGPIQVVGPCSQLLLGLITVGVCASQDPTGRYLYDCALPGNATLVPSITTFLAGPIPW